MPRLSCAVCGGTATVEGTMCPRSLHCPDCGAKPHMRCKRPSGHEASELHAARWEAAEAWDVEQGLATYVNGEITYEGIS